MNYASHARLRIVTQRLGTLMALCVITVLLAGKDSPGESSAEPGSAKPGSANSASAKLAPAKPVNAEPSVRVPSNVAWTVQVVKTASGGDAFRGLLLARR